MSQNDDQGHAQRNVGIDRYLTKHRDQVVGLKELTGGDGYDHTQQYQNAQDTYVILYDSDDRIGCSVLVLIHVTLLLLLHISLSLPGSARLCRALRPVFLHGQHRHCHTY